MVWWTGGGCSGTVGGGGQVETDARVGEKHIMDPPGVELAAPFARFSSLDLPDPQWEHPRLVVASY